MMIDDRIWMLSQFIQNVSHFKISELKQLLHCFAIQSEPLLLWCFIEPWSFTNTLVSLQLIESLLNTKLPEDIQSALRDGVLLCHLANMRCPHSIPSVHVPSAMTVGLHRILIPLDRKIYQDLVQFDLHSTMLLYKAVTIYQIGYSVKSIFFKFLLTYINWPTFINWPARINWPTWHKIDMLA